MSNDKKIYDEKLDSVIYDLKNLIGQIIDENQQLTKNIHQLEEEFTKCNITGLATEKDFLGYIYENFIPNSHATLMLIGIDNMTDINFKYGSEVGNETIRNLSYLLLNNKIESGCLFKLQGAMFGYCILGKNKNEAIIIGENIRKAIFDSEAFIQKITISIGLVYYDEINNLIQDNDDFSGLIYNVALNRLKVARNRGMNSVCSESGIEEDNNYEKKILIADTDTMNLRILKNSLEKEGYKVLVANDGVEAIEIIERENLSVVISELILPKIDGFSIREKMFMNSSKATIPFILMSYRKDNETVARALDLNINHYFKKPYMLTELVGVTKNKIKEER